MRRVISQQMSFGDGFIDRSLYDLDEELKKVDELLSSPALVKPFEEVFDESMGRPGTPAGVYLRIMYLKFRWGLSYEEVETEVRERLTWRYFCHLSLMDVVPDATTLIKLNQKARFRGHNTNFSRRALDWAPRSSLHQNTARFSLKHLHEFLVPGWPSRAKSS